MTEFKYDALHDLTILIVYFLSLQRLIGIVRQKGVIFKEIYRCIYKTAQFYHTNMNVFTDIIIFFTKTV